MKAHELSIARYRTVRSGERLIARISRPELSRLVLSVAGFIVSAVLMIWLLILAFFARSRHDLLGIWVAPHSMVAPFIRHQEDDLRGLTGRTDSDDGRTLEASIRDRIVGAGSGSQPLALYVSAVGVSDRNGNYFLRSDQVAPGRETLYVEKLIERLTERRRAEMSS